MSIFNGIHLNPFALHTAKNEWETRDRPLPQRVLRASSGVVYDIFLKNPYDITIGNAKTIFVTSKTQYTKIQKAAGAAFILIGALYAFMLYGGTIWYSGTTIVAAGTAVGWTGLKSIGLLIQTIGEKIFLTGAVPVYGLCYLLPKKIALFLPVMAKFVAKKMAYISRIVLLPVRDKVLVPCLKQGLKVVEWSQLLLLRVHHSLQAILSPFREKVLVPCLKQSIKAIEWTGDFLHSAHRFLGRILTTLFRNTVQPLWNTIIKPAARFVEKVILLIIPPIKKALSFLIARVATAAQWVWTNLFIPPFSFVGKKVAQIAEAITENFYILANKVSTMWNHFFLAHS